MKIEVHIRSMNRQHWSAVFVSVIASTIILLLIALALPLVSSFSANIYTLPTSSKRPSFALFATPPRSSSTARDSALSVEWEPVPELQRRIEDGIHYEHWRNDWGSDGARHPEVVEDIDGGAEEEEAELVKGVFFGYRVTPEERARLRSADPNEPGVYDI